MTKRMMIMLIIVGAVFAAIIGYQMFVASMMKQMLTANVQPPATVTAVQARVETWQPQLGAVGTLRALQGVEVSNEVAGIVKKVHFKSGDVVARGDLLLELNADDNLAQLDALKAAEKFAEITLIRDTDQFKAKAISRARLDASEADLESKTAQVAQQQAIIAKKRIRAPFSGRLGVTTVNPGQYLNAAEPIVSLQNTKSLYVDFAMPQKHLGALKVGGNISLSSDAFAGERFAGRISAVNPAVDASTRNVRVEGVIDNEAGKLAPGMFVKVRLDAGAPSDYITLPQTAIGFNAYGSTVFIARKDEPDDQAGGETALTAQQVFVKTGDTRGDQVAILEGVKEGDMVVTSGQLKLKNGTPLIINNDVLPANDPSPTPQEQ